ncbi:MAG: hypothetical protein IGR76_19255 [Synechococcales cyanobacterium T60_A2020_003]|nr:hypothetical protein [Synechococcales cyanobacterium T60_A2020_003]
MKTKLYRNGLYGLLALVLVASVGCSAGNQDSSSASKGTPSEQTSDKAMPKQSQEFVVQNGSGATTVSLKPTDNGAELVDASGQTLATYTMTESDDGKKVEIKDASGQVTGFIAIKGKNYTIQDASQKQLFALRAGGDQRHRFVNATDENIYVLKVKENGYVVRDAEKQVINKVKGGKQSVLQTAEKQAVLQAEGLSPLAIAVFGFSELSQEQQGALAYVVNTQGAKAAKPAKADKKGKAEDGEAAPKKEKKSADTPADTPEAAESPKAE